MTNPTWSLEIPLEYTYRGVGLWETFVSWGISPEVGPLGIRSFGLRQKIHQWGVREVAYDLEPIGTTPDDWGHVWDTIPCEDTYTGTLLTLLR